MSQTAKSDPSPSAPETPFVLAWDPDPLVVCSRRTRDVSVPAALLMRDPTEKERAAWAAPTAMSMVAQVTVRLNAGATFLGAGVTQWLYRGLTSHAQVKGTPPPESLVALWPKSSEDNTLRDAPRFKGHESNAVDPAKVCVAWQRVLAFLREEEKRVLEQDGVAPLTLFTAKGGYDAPELVVCRVSELFRMQTVDGQHAQPHVMGSIKWAKDGRHLGALHDYALRHPGGSVIAMACQQRLQGAPGLGPQ